MLLAAQELGCVRAAALIAALSQSRGILLKSEGKRMDETREDILGGEGESDVFTLMRAWRFAQGRQFDPQRCRPLGIHAGSAREVAGTLDQLLRLSERAGLDVAEKPASSESIQRCILAGFSDQLARRVDQGTLRCRLVHNRTGELVRDSVVRKSALFVAGEIREVESRDELRVLLSQATAVEEAWLRDAFPDDFSEGTQTLFDPNLRRVVTRRTRLFRDLVLDFTEHDCADAEEAARLLAEEVLSGRCPLKHWDDAVEQWFVRLACLRAWMPELGLPEADAEARRAMVGGICHGAFSYKAIKDAEVWPALRGWLPAAGPAPARPIRAGAAGAARRAQGQGHLYRGQRADDRRAHPGSVRRDEPDRRQGSPAGHDPRSSRRTSGRCRSRPTSRISGRRVIRKSGRSFPANIPGTNGDEFALARRLSRTKDGRCEACLSPSGLWCWVLSALSLQPLSWRGKQLADLQDELSTANATLAKLTQSTQQAKSESDAMSARFSN